MPIINEVTTDFAQEVYRRAAMVNNDIVKKMDVRVLIKIILMVIQFLMIFSPLFGKRDSHEVIDKFHSLNIFERMAVRRAIRKYAKEYQGEIYHGLVLTIQGMDEKKMAKLMEQYKNVTDSD